MQQLTELNAKFAIKGKLEFVEQAPGVVLAKIANEFATATVSLYAGQVLTFQPVEAAPVLWLSEKAFYEPGKAIRGGIPVCWPWFGPHASDSSKPAHGFVRTAQWDVVGSRQLDGGQIELTLQIVDSEATRAMWPHAFELTQVITVGEHLNVSLTTRNTGKEAFEISEALHTYFKVGDIRQIGVLGLEETSFLDKVDGGKEKTQSGPVQFAGETDNVYLNTESSNAITDPVLERSIILGKTDSHTTVVWNPWVDKCAKMADTPADDWQHFVCVEAANAFPGLRIEAGASHMMQVTYMA